MRSPMISAVVATITNCAPRIQRRRRRRRRHSASILVSSSSTTSAYILLLLVVNCCCSSNGGVDASPPPSSSEPFARQSSSSSVVVGGGGGSPIMQPTEKTTPRSSSATTSSHVPPSSSFSEAHQQHHHHHINPPQQQRQPNANGGGGASIMQRMARNHHHLERRRTQPPPSSSSPPPPPTTKAAASAAAAAAAFVGEAVPLTRANYAKRATDSVALALFLPLTFLDFTTTTTAANGVQGGGGGGGGGGAAANVVPPTTPGALPTRKPAAVVQAAQAVGHRRLIVAAATAAAAHQPPPPTTPPLWEAELIRVLGGTLAPSFGALAQLAERIDVDLKLAYKGVRKQKGWWGRLVMSPKDGLLDLVKMAREELATLIAQLRAAESGDKAAPLNVKRKRKRFLLFFKREQKPRKPLTKTEISNDVVMLDKILDPFLQSFADAKPTKGAAAADTPKLGGGGGVNANVHTEPFFDFEKLQNASLAKILPKGGKFRAMLHFFAKKAFVVKALIAKALGRKSPTKLLNIQDVKRVGLYLYIRVKRLLEEPALTQDFRAILEMRRAQLIERMDATKDFEDHPEKYPHLHEHSSPLKKARSPKGGGASSLVKRLAAGLRKLRGGVGGSKAKKTKSS